ncbi:MAG TPA: aldehyde dehydrogenase family protein [Syntrophobacteria bacterium]|nr:aldehyde dehydrogenase family protein [Syntrophobacteria bacterium]
MSHNQPADIATHTVCRNPATGEILGHSPLTPVEELTEIVARARAAQPTWAALSREERVRAIVRVRDYVVTHAEELAEVIARDTGKTRVDALATEVFPAALAADYYGRQAKRFLKDRWIRPGSILLANKVSKIVRAPHGVIGVISPWNYPFSIPFSEVVMGLLAGNAVILKTATETQMVGRALERCFLAAALPDGVFAYVNIPGRLAGSALLKGGIDKLFFTGSVAVGKELVAEAAATLTPLVLELGGNDAMLVCEDADLERSAAGALWAGFQNCGQSCAGVERIYVHDKVYGDFLLRLKEKVEALRVGYDESFDVDMGAMTTARQVATVERHVEDALAKGAVIYARSAEPKEGRAGNFLPALMLTDVNHDMLVMKEETFGPVVGVMKVKDMEEAVRLANDSHLGLTGSVWSRDWGAAERLARRIQAGVVTINDHLVSHGLAETPWGGFKHSGIGRTHGAIGFAEMTQPQVIVHDLLPFARRSMWWYPHGKGLHRGLLGALQFLYGRSLSHRLKGLWQLLRIVPRYFTRG